MNTDDQNKMDKEQKKDIGQSEEERNDTADTGDDTIGENTEITPLAAAVLKDKDERVQAKENQENKDPSEKNG